MDPNQVQNRYGGEIWQEIEQNPASINSNYVAQYMVKVYAWMFLALMLTAGVAYLTAGSEEMIKIIFQSRIAVWGLIIGQIFLVGFLAVRIQKMSVGLAMAVFLFYSILNGFTFAVYLLRFEANSVFKVFAITAGTFGAMSLIGYFTKTDLTRFGRLLLMGLVGLIIASLVNFFTKSETLYWMLSYVGVAIFVGLIAYDTQKIKQYALLDSAEDRKRGAIMGALALYLDFINLFVYLLRIMGDRR